MTWMSQRLRLFVPWNSVSVASIGITLLLLLLSIFWDSYTIALALASFELILIQARIPLHLFLRDTSIGAWLRSAIRVGVFFLPAFFLSLPPVTHVVIGLIAGVLCALLLQLTQWRDLKFVVSDAFIQMLNPLPRQEGIRQGIQIVFASAGQEFFYRGMLLPVLAPLFGIWAILIATLCFVVEHLLHFNSAEAFDTRDILLQAILSVGLGMVMYFTGSILGCMLGHILYNSPFLYQTIRRAAQLKS